MKDMIGWGPVVMGFRSGSRHPRTRLVVRLPRLGPRSEEVKTRPVSMVPL